MKWYSSCISFDIHFEHFLLFRAIFIWQPVSINKLWDDNLILEIAFLNLKLFNLCKYSDSVKLTFNSLYKNNDEHKLMSLLQLLLEIISLLKSLVRLISLLLIQSKQSLFSFKNYILKIFHVTVFYTFK